MSAGHPSPTRPVTMKDIAEKAGVDVSAVSRALRDPNRYSQATTKRIFDAAAELGYDPALNQGARRLIMRRYGKHVANNLIGLFFPAQFYHSAFHAAIFEGISSVLAEQGYGVMLVDPLLPRGKVLPPSFGRGDVDASIIMIGMESAPQTLQILRDNRGFADRPVVTIMSQLPGCSSVLPDAEAGAYAAAKHLLDQGHRRMLYFRLANDQPFGFHQDQFYPGYRQACLDRGLNPDDFLVPAEIDARFKALTFTPANIQKYAVLNVIKPGVSRTGRAVQAELLRLLRKNQDITAILAPNDPVAIFLRHHLLQAGIRVPEDMSLVGFDDTNPLYDEDGRNMLTTVRLPLAMLGQKAAKLAVDHVMGRQDEVKHVTVPGRFIVRRSTAPIG